MKNFIVLMLCLIGMASKAADIYYVTPTGARPNDPSYPLGTYVAIDGIGTGANPGDIFYFMNGTYLPKYADSPILEIRNNGTAANYITYRNYPGHSPLFKFDSWEGIKISGASYITIQGLRVQGANSTITASEANAQPYPSKKDANGDPLKDANGNLIPETGYVQPSSTSNTDVYTNCSNSHIGVGEKGKYNGTGITVIGPYLKWSPSFVSDKGINGIPHHINILENEVYECSSSGIAVYNADYITVSKCKVYNNCWYTLFGTSGINFYQMINTDGTTTEHNVIEKNLIYGNKLIVPPISTKCIKYDGAGLILDDFNSTQCFNMRNRASNSLYPCNLAYTAKTTVKNNIIVNNGGPGIQCFLSKNADLKHNTIYFNGTSSNEAAATAVPEIKINGCSDIYFGYNIVYTDLSRLDFYHYYASDFGNSIANQNFTSSYNLFWDNSRSGPSNFDAMNLYKEDVTDFAFANTSVTASHPFRTIKKIAVRSNSSINDDYLGDPRSYTGTIIKSYSAYSNFSFTVRVGEDIGAYSGSTYCGTDLTNTNLIQTYSTTTTNDIINNETVIMRATNSIVMSPNSSTGGFVVKAGSVFIAQIGTCQSSSAYRLEDESSENMKYPIAQKSELSSRSYPNPISSGELNFGHFFNTYSLMNNQGIVLLEGKNADKLTISDLSKGIYLLKLDDKTEKIIIQ